MLYKLCLIRNIIFHFMSDECLFMQVGVTLVMVTDSAAAMGGRAGSTFGVELVGPWDAPEAVVDLHSDGVMDLETARTLLA